jgi:hypothetical protein
MKSIPHEVGTVKLAGASCPANQVALRSTKLIRVRLWTGADMEAQLKG